MKFCPNCKLNKENNEFHKSSRSDDLLQSYCKICKVSLTKKRRESNIIQYKQENKKHNNKWYKNNLKKSKEDTKKFFERHPGRARHYWLKKTYGITLEDFNVMFNKQNGVCAICSKPETIVDKKTGKVKSLSVDHCHKTGIIRGLLCSSHNQAIGLFKDSSELLRFAADYLEKKR